MPIHAVTYVYTDRPADLEAIRPEHRSYLNGLHESGSLLASGPLPATDNAAAGALLVLEAPGPRDVAALLDADPFAIAGLVAHRDIRPWAPVIGDWAHRV